jgi:hypothetical protein
MKEQRNWNEESNEQRNKAARACCALRTARIHTCAHRCSTCKHTLRTIPTGLIQAILILPQNGGGLGRERKKRRRRGREEMAPWEMGGGRMHEEGGRAADGECLEDAATALARGWSGGPIIFCMCWATVGAPTVGAAGLVDAPLLRYSCRCCISRSRAATAVLTADSSTTREEGCVDEEETSECGTDGGTKGEEYRGEARCRDAHQRMQRRRMRMRTVMGTGVMRSPCATACESRVRQ